MQSESFLEKLFDETPDFDGSGGFSEIEAFLGDEVIKDVYVALQLAVESSQSGY